MKRNFVAALCAGALTVSLACGVYALTGDESLVSLSHITDVFAPGAVKEGVKQVEKTLNKTYSNALEDLEDTQKDLIKEATGSENPYSAVLSPRNYNAGDMITLETGAGVFHYAGTARVSHDGAFIDITEGVEVPSGGKLTAGHRYLVGEDTIADVIVLSGAAQLGLQGGYVLENGEEVPTPFYDVSMDDWYYDAVAYVYDAGIFTGTADTQFSPHLTMDRSMLMTGFYRLAGSPQREMDQATATFTDVPESAWYYKFVRWAATQEITAGIGDNKFGPAVQLTREQVVTLLYSFATRYMGMTLNGRTDVTGYSDYAKSSEWARDALSWAVYYGVLDESWAGENTLGGHQYADRAEVSAMLAAFAEKIL